MSPYTDGSSLAAEDDGIVAEPDFPWDAVDREIQRGLRSHLSPPCTDPTIAGVLAHPIPCRPKWAVLALAPCSC